MTALLRLVPKLAVAAASVVVAVAVGEVAVRVLAPQAAGGTLERTLDAYRGVYRLQPRYVYEMLPSLPPREDRQPEFRYTFGTNSAGLRDREFDAKTGLRIIGIGDSFAFGHGVETDQTYAKALERVLRARQIAAEVINAGVPGYGTAQEYFQLRDKMLAYEPDVVVLGFYVGNDITDNVQYEDYVWTIDDRGFLTRRPSSGPPTPPPSGIVSFPFKRWIRVHSELYNFVAWSLVDVRLRRGYLPHDSALTLRPYLRTSPPDMEHAWERTRHWLQATKDLLDERGIPFLLVVIPFEFQVNTGKWADGFFQRRASEYWMEKPQAELRDFCERAHVRCLDLLPGLRERTRAGQALYFRQGHLNAAGHRVSAELVAARLIADGLPNVRAARPSAPGATR